MSVLFQATTGEVRLFGRPVGNPGWTPKGHRCLIVAELGINHQGDPLLAHKMIDAAADAGVDVVKLQKRVLSATYRADILADPQRGPVALGHYLPVLQKAELPEEAWPALRDHAQKRGLGFLVTPWDEPSVVFLERLGVEAYKIASADFANPFLHRAVAATGKPVIVSTGMATELDIFTVVPELKSLLAGRLVLMHTVSAYPTAFRDCQLHSILRMKVNHGVPVGWSGHERGVAVSVAAASLGADVLERHFTMDRTLVGPDQAASLEPEGLKRLVERVRAFEEAYGDPLANKAMTRGEMQSQEVLGKSLVARRRIGKGQVIQWADLEARSPGRGLAPWAAHKIAGHALAARDIVEGEALDPAAIKDPAREPAEAPRG